MPVPDSDRWTAARFLAWQAPRDGRRYELLAGALIVSPGPTFAHQLVVDELHAALRAYTVATRNGRALQAPLDVRLTDDTVLEPDIVVVRARRGARRLAVPLATELLLAVEVLSPSTSAQALDARRAALLQAGVPTLWVADPDDRSITTWSATDDVGRVHHTSLTWAPRANVAPLVLDLRALFADALDR
ncbi:MAG: Uma2 family endonuclease [Gemmatimonadaceae bacterium]|nr:Uma2 family endonuclease [Gemmatimonadaceae bacterium]